MEKLREFDAKAIALNNFNEVKKEEEKLLNFMPTSDIRSLKTSSEAWPMHERADHVALSSTHSLLQDRPEDLSEYYFRDLELSDIKEIVRLHREWFPVNYNFAFFYKIAKKQKNISLGCFVRYKGVEYVLGTIMTKVERNKAFLNEKGVSERFLCGFVEGAYIMTIGVVDESRRHGIGTQLLHRTI